jgi:REP element-mobilizing transposase RayT
MPSHFHWIIVIDPEKGTISDIMREIKRNSSKEITKYLENISKYKEVFRKEAMIYRDQYKKFWMKRFDDEVIRNEKMFWQKLNYIHKNPVEAGIVKKEEDYKYSSARNYINGDHSLLKVDVEYAGIKIV